MNFDRSRLLAQNLYSKAPFFRKINVLVLHHIAANSVDEAIQLLIDNGVSAHFLVDEEGKIFQLVDENDIAYHAGISYWSGFESLNQNSIGIEFLNSDPFTKKFSDAQMLSAVQLTKYIAAKYQIAPKNIVGHSDIAYDKTTQKLDRKQDPSHLFDWKFLAKNYVGIFPEVEKDERVLFKAGDVLPQISLLKKTLNNFGYRVVNFDGNFDDEMKCLVRVFNRRFIGQDCDQWLVTSAEVLDFLHYNQKGK